MTGNIKNSDSMDILNQIRIPLSDITGISRLLKYNLANMETCSESQINALMDLINALDENTSHILSLLNENLENEYEEKSDLAVPKADLTGDKAQYKNLAGKKILVVDDIELNRVLIGLMLKNIDIEVVDATNGHEALNILNESQDGEYDLILMDIMMPVMDGLTAMAQLRQTSNVPVILLTAKGEDTDKVLGLNVGADDYITKPFNPVELLARVRSQLRRYLQLGGGQVQASTLVIGGICLDDNAKTVTVDGDPVALTPKEYDILRFLMRNAGTVFSPNEIYRRVWEDVPLNAAGAIAVHIRHLREKLEINPSEPRYIKVVWGKGYKMEGSPS